FYNWRAAKLFQMLLGEAAEWIESSSDGSVGFELIAMCNLLN
ncbi:unnamed protein product, partial [Rotaria sp. Silwood1]